MLIYLYGDDDFRSEEALQGYVAAFKKKHDPSGLSVVRLDGERVTPEELQRSLATQGLLTKMQLVVIRALSSQRSGAAADVLLTLIEEKRLPAEVVIIVWEPGTPGAGKKRVHPLFPALAALPARQPKKPNQDFQERYNSLVGRQLERWVDERAVNRGIRFTPPARGELIGLTASDLRLINQEIEKLSHYKPNAIIGESDVKLFVHAQLEPNIFDLTDAIGERDLATALTLLQEQFRAGAAPLYLVTMLTRHFRILRSIQAAGEGHPATLARQLKLHPFVVGKALQQVRRFAPDELVRRFSDIVSLDAKLKSGATDPETELTLFVTRACRISE